MRMKKRNRILFCLICSLVFTMTACGTKEDKTTQSESVEITETETPAKVEESSKNNSTQEHDATEDDFEYEGEASTVDMNKYKDVLDEHYQAFKEKWGAEKLINKGLSSLFTYCYKGNPLENIEYSFQDVNNDGYRELFLQTGSGDKFVKGMVFEMYTMKDGKPVQVFCGDERNRYYLSDTEEGAYFICNYSSSGATQSMWNYYTLNGDELNLQQGIIYDEESDEKNPWSMTYSEDESGNNTVDEKMALDIIKSYEKRQLLPDPFQFSLYNPE